MGAGVGGGAEFQLRIREVIEADEASARKAATTFERIFEQSAAELNAKLQAQGAAGGGGAALQAELAAAQRRIKALTGFAEYSRTGGTDLRSAPAAQFRKEFGVQGEELRSLGQQLAKVDPKYVAQVNSAFERLALNVQGEAQLSAQQAALSRKRAIALQGQAEATLRLEAAEVEAATLARLNTKEYAEQQALLQKLNAEIAAKVAEEKLDNGFIAAEARRVQITEQLNAALQKRLADEGFGVTQAQTAVQRSRIAAQKAETLTEPQNAAILAEEQRAVAQQKAQLAQILASDKGYIEAQAQATAAKKLEAAKTQELVVGDEAYRQTVAIETANRARVAAIKAQEAAAFAATPEGLSLAAETARADVELKGVAQAQRKLTTEAQRVVELQTLLGLDRLEVKATAKSVEDAIRLNRLGDELIATRAKRLQLEALATSRGIIPPTGGAGTGTTGSGGRAQPGGIGFGQGFRSVLRFGVASTVLFGLAAGASEAVREATELDRIFNQVERQFRSQFSPSIEIATQQFADFKREVFETAELTGQAADEVANVGFQLQGAFEGDTVRAIQETRDAIIAARVTGLDVNEVVDSFTALTQSFDGLTIERVSDAALQLQEDLGVLAKETITFAADLAPVGAELGFTVEKLAAIGAVAQQTSGRSGTALAEAFGRVLPQINESAIEIIQIFEALGPEVAATVQRAFAAGDIDAVFDQVLINFERIEAAGLSNELGDLLGGRREFQSIIGVLNNGSKVFEEYNKAQNSAGKTAEYFSDLQETLQQRIARLGEEFKRLVQVLFEAGLKDFFVDFVDLLSVSVRLLETMFGLLGSIGGALGPLSGPLLLALQAGVLLRGGRAVRGGFASALGRPATGGVRTAGAFTSPRAPATGVDMRARFAATQQGSRFASLTGRGFIGGLAAAIPSITTLGVGMGAFYMTQLDANVREGAEKKAEELSAGLGAGKKLIDTEIERLFTDIGLGSVDADAVRSALESGRSVGELIRTLGNQAEEDASLYQQALDILPGEGSKEISNLQAEIEAAVLFLAEGVSEGFRSGLDNISADDSFRKEVEQVASSAMRRLFAGPPLLTEGSVSLPTTFGDGLVVEAGLFNEIVQQIAEDPLVSLEKLGQRLPAELQSSYNELLNEVSDTGRFGGRDTATLAFDVGSIVDGITGNLEGAKEVQKRINEGIKTGKIEQALLSIQADVASEDLVLDPAVADYFQEIVDFVASAGDTLNTVQEKATEAITTLDEALSQFELGTLTAGEVERIRSSAIAKLEALGRTDEALELMIDARKFALDRLSDELDALASLSDLTGQDLTESGVKRVQDSIADEELGLTLAEEGELALQALDLLKERREILAQSIEDETERQAFLNAKIQAPPDITQAILASLLATNQGFADALSNAFQGNQQKVDEVIREITRVAVEGQLTLAEAASQVIGLQVYTQARVEKMIADLEAGFRDLTGYVRDAAIYYSGVQLSEDRLKGLDFTEAEEILNQVSSDFDSLTSGLFAGPGGGGAGAGGGDDAAKTAQELAEARLDLLLAQVEGDPVAEAQIAQQQADIAYQYAETEADRIRAQAERIRANRQLEEAFQEIAAAHREISLAFAEGDPVAEAKAAQREASIAFDQARSQVERLQALAAGVRADRQLRDALFDITQAEIELVIAKANAAGETVEAAKLSLKQIEQQLYHAGATGDDAEFIRLKAQLEAARANVRDTTLSDRREYFQYLSDVGKITQGQLVNYLQSLLAIPDLTQQQIRDIEREIYNLRQQLGQDFQFNLPTNLQLPTLYEVRRFDQSSGTAGGYNDNRQIVVTVEVATDASPDQIAEAVATAVGDPSRTGTTTRRY